MDQLKDILKQLIKYRFWITVGLAALLSMIGYFVGSGPVKAKAKATTDEITQANTEVRKYSSGVVPNAQYKPIVDEKKNELVKDVNASWKKLYARQAPLLTWPATVDERFRTWERKWPENVDASAIQLAIIEYVTAYPKFVNEVYQSFHPFDVVEGTGLVSAPPEDVLLKPFPFTIENPPDLGKVWAAQERLWTQRTLLDVVAQVNKDARDWNTATIKQINLLEVGDSLAQDQKSIASGETLVEAPPIANPASPPPAAPDPNTPAEPGGTPGMTNTFNNTQSVYYIKNDSTQFKILPFQLSVLIEQNRVQDLLVTLENSPMAIQVMEFEMSKPSNRVVKPVKGQNMDYAGYSAGGGGAGPMPGQMEIFGARRGPGAPMPGMGPMAGGGRDLRGSSRRDQRKLEEAAVKQATGVTIHDPYFNIVEVTVYGQARFYNPPPVEPPAQPSVAEGTPAATPEGTPAAAPATPPGEAPKAEGEAAKAETPKAEGEAAKAETPKEEAPVSTPAPAPAPPPGGEAPKADAAAPK